MEKKLEVITMSDSVLLVLQKDIAEIKVALLGNEYNPSGGLLCRTTELERELEKLKTRYDKMIWAAGGAGAAISFIVSVLYKLVFTIPK